MNLLYSTIAGVVHLLIEGSTSTFCDVDASSGTPTSEEPTCTTCYRNFRQVLRPPSFEEKRSSFAELKPLDRKKHEEFMEKLAKGENPFSKVLNIGGDAPGDVKEKPARASSIKSAPKLTKYSSQDLPIRKIKEDRKPGEVRCIGCSRAIKGPIYSGSILRGTKFLKRSSTDHTPVLGIITSVRSSDVVTFRGEPFATQVIGGLPFLVHKTMPYQERTKGNLCELCRSNTQQVVTGRDKNGNPITHPLVKVDSNLPIDKDRATLPNPSPRDTRSIMTEDLGIGADCPRSKILGRGGYFPTGEGRQVRRTGKTFQRLPDHPAGFRTTKYRDE